MEQQGKLTATQAKVVLGELLEHGGDPAEIAGEKGFRGARGRSRWWPSSVTVVAAHPRNGSATGTATTKLAGFFTGVVMKATKGKAYGKAIAESSTVARLSPRLTFGACSDEPQASAPPERQRLSGPHG